MLSTPVMAVGDGPSHVFSAAAEVRGELGGRLVPVGSLGREEQVKVPADLAALSHVADCLPTNLDALPTTCVRPVRPKGPTAVVTTQFNRSPPLFYLLIGWPSLLASGRTAYWAMTAVATVADAVLLSLGLWVLLSFQELNARGLAWLLAVSPEVLFLAGTVNSSGFEASAAVAAWCAAVTVSGFARPPRAACYVLGVSLSCLIVTRPASPATAVVILAAAALLAGRRNLRSIVRYRPMLIALVAAGAAFAAALSCYLVLGAEQLLGHAQRPVGVLSALHIGWLNEPAQALGMYGGFPGFGAPRVALACWVVGAACLAVCSLSGSSRRPIAVALALVVAVLALAPVATALEYNRIGLWWQARYSVPLAVGVPLVLAYRRAGEHPGTGRSSLAAAGCAVALLGDVITFVFVLHRYGSGMAGPWTPWRYPWQPPLGAVGLLAIVAASSAGLIAVCTRFGARPSRAGSADPSLTP